MTMSSASGRLPHMNVSHGARWLMKAICLIVVAWTPGCSGNRDYQAFLQSHDSIRPSMTIREVFDAGLADYLIRMETKTVSGATRPEKQPASSDCQRHVLEIMYWSEFLFSGTFKVRVYCEMNDPSARQVTPERSFTTKQEFLEALDTVSSSWARSMSFRVESPPMQLFGVYDSYEFATDHEGRVVTVSPVIVVPRR